MAREVTVGDFFSYAENLAGKDKLDNKLPVPAVPWIGEHFIDPVSKKTIQLQPYQRRILRQALQFDANGYSRYGLVVWSQPKKSGKTAIAGAVGAWVACEVEQPNEVSCVANDQEQSAGRIFSAMTPTLEHLHWKVPETPRGVLAHNPATGSMVKAITTRYQGEAGANPGITLWSELWAYSGERLNRLWDEMTPPPTRKFSMRWVETYAGFKQESLLLYGFYKKIFKDYDKPYPKELNPGVFQLWKDLPVYEIPDERTLVFWDHAHRMPWQTADYYNGQRSQLRATAYERMHGNRWVDSSEQFITEDMWQQSCRRDGPLRIRATYALDAGKNDDCFALVGCVKIGGVVHTADVHIWESHDKEEFDQNTIMQVIIDLHKAGKLQPPLWYDPYQLVKMAQDLRNVGIPCQEFSQGAERVKADTSLYKHYVGGTIVNWNHPLLRQHVLSAQAQFQGKDKEDCRIVKPAPTGNAEEDRLLRKVDGCVAKSMAAHKAYTVSGGGWTLSGI